MAYSSFCAKQSNIYYTDGLELAGPPPCWTDISHGLPAVEMANGWLDIFRVDPFTPTSKQYAMVEESGAGSGIYKRDLSIAGGWWVRMLDISQARTLTGNLFFEHPFPSHQNESFCGLVADPLTPGRLVATYGFFCAYAHGPIGEQHDNQFIFESLDYGVTWSLALSVKQTYSIGEIDVRGDAVFYSSCDSGSGPVMFRSLTGLAGAYDHTASLGGSAWTSSPRIDPHDPTRCFCGEYSSSVITQFDLSIVGDPIVGGELTITQLRPGGLPIFNDYLSTKTRIDKLWVDENLAGHCRLCDNQNIYITFDNFSTISSTLAVPVGSPTWPLWPLAPTDNGTALACGTGHGIETYSVWACEDEAIGPLIPLVNCPVPPPCTPVPGCEIPYDTNYLSRYGLWIGIPPLPAGIYTHAVELDDIPGQVEEGIPLHGDRGVWEVIDYPGEHARDIDEGTWEYHHGPGVGSAHFPISLDADAGAVLDITETGANQEIGLDEQDENLVWAGPVTAPADEPTFRRLVAADVGTGAPDGTKFLRDDMTWQPAGGGGSCNAILTDDNFEILVDDDGFVLCDDTI